MAKRKHKNLNESTSPQFNKPAVSVIIPMYNTEKYIGECLDSLLAQTLKNIEVIVVDDCSTDNSAAIVESYLEKFNGRLKISRLKKNSGGAPVPRNRGIKISSGEYLFFMDSDDAILPDGLEGLYSAAKKFDADVVHCERYYEAPGNTVTTDKNLLKVMARREHNFVTEPTLETKDLEERVKIFLDIRFWWVPWIHLIRRDLMIENEIEFPKLSIADDVVFSFFVYCFADNVVRVPNIVYVYRTLQDSNSHAALDAAKSIRRRGGDIFLSIKILEEFTKKFPLFQEKSIYKYKLFDFCLERNIGVVYEVYAKFPANQVYDLVKERLEEIGNDPCIAAYIFSRMNLLSLQLMGTQQKLIQLNQFAVQAQKRIKELEAEVNRLKGGE